MIRLFYLGIISLLCGSAMAQVGGCTDAQSENYNPLAEVNDGSCIYRTTSVAPVKSYILSDSLHETSGLILWNDQLLTHNDDTDNNLHVISKAGMPLHQFHLSGTVNNDWEDIAQDSSYIYVGDFGNNSSGNRSDLKILRILKSSLTEPKVTVDTISFSYQDQKSLAKVPSNTTDFDCEAFIVTSEFIYLFTKQWTSQKTTIYRLTKSAETQTAVPVATWDVGGLITGATYLEDKNLIALCGYTSVLKPFIYLLYDFKGDQFFEGNKRKIKLPLQFHQIEGIASEDGINFFLSNERFKKSFLNVPPKLHVFDLSEQLENYLQSSVSSDGIPIVKKEISISYDDQLRMINVNCESIVAGTNYILYDDSRNIALTGSIDHQIFKIDVSQLPNAQYILVLGDSSDYTFPIEVK